MQDSNVTGSVVGVSDGSSVGVSDGSTVVGASVGSGGVASSIVIMNLAPVFVLQSNSVISIVRVTLASVYGTSKIIF